MDPVLPPKILVINGKKKKIGRRMIEEKRTKLCGECRRERRVNIKKKCCVTC